MSEVATLDLNDRRTWLKQKMTEAQQELIATLEALTPEQADVKITLEIAANVPTGIPTKIVTTITENVKAL